MKTIALQDFIITGKPKFKEGLIYMIEEQTGKTLIDRNLLKKVNEKISKKEEKIEVKKEEKTAKEIK